MQEVRKKLKRSAVWQTGTGIAIAVAILVLFSIDLRFRYDNAIEQGKKNALNFAEILSEHTALTFEGFFFAAEDSRGPFFFTQNISRSESEGSKWAASLCLLPSVAQTGPQPKQCT